MQCIDQRGGFRNLRVRTKVAPERKFVSRHRLEIRDNEILGTVSRWLDGEIGITRRIETCVFTHRFDETFRLVGWDVDREIDDVKPRVAGFEVQGFGESMKLYAAHRALGGEETFKAIQDIGIRMYAVLDDASRIARLPLEPQLCDVFDRVAQLGEDENGDWNSNEQHEPRQGLPGPQPLQDLQAEAHTGCAENEAPKRKRPNRSGLFADAAEGRARARF